MPAYDYRCEPCDARFEISRPLGETGDVVCPRCGQVAKRVFTPVGVVFKGSGFHSTDYRAPHSPTPTASSSDAPASAPACPSAGTSASCSNCPVAE